MIREDIKKKLTLSIEDQAQMYFKNYKPVMEAFEKYSLKGKLSTIQPYDYVALGRMLESFDVVKAMNEASGGDMNSMGILPTIALTSRAA